jgi:serine phosphatase RsbU (regulator of sigma subunit)
MNPAAKTYFPEMQDQKLEHPLFNNVKIHVFSKKEFQCEVVVDNKIFEQKIYFVPDTDLIRVYCHDITQQKKNEKNLLRLASFPEQNPSPIIEIDLDGIITYYNPAVLFNFPDFQLLKNEHSILVPFKQHVEKLKSGEIDDYSIEIKHLDKFYTQRARIFKEYQVIRIFNIDITQEKQAEAQIREKNKEIIDSINYAKRIQQAKLPKKEEIYASIPNCFILFKPKDIVSGDFYFFHKGKQTVFLAAADCTGHGVAGAFMSLIGSERLEDAVSQSEDTSQILKLVNKGIKKSLRQSRNDESSRDGMDIALCSIDIENHIVKFAGANRPLWIIRNQQTTVEEIKATKTSIGGYTEDNQHFDTHELKLSPGDTLYIFTDGFADQFNGSSGKKLMKKLFKEKLLEIQEKPMKEQEHYLDHFIDHWKSGTEQIDDILVIGIRL